MLASRQTPGKQGHLVRPHVTICYVTQVSKLNARYADEQHIVYSVCELQPDMQGNQFPIILDMQ